MADSETKQETGLPAPTAPPKAANVEAGTGTSWISRSWRREDMLKKGSWALRISALVFSVLSFLIMVFNKHGDHNDWRNFDKYEEFRYLLGISILSLLYSGAQVFRLVRELSTGRSILDRRNALMVDFAGDQILAYLLFSAASAAVPMTDRMREGADNIFTDSLAASISMAFFAFFALAIAALISGYKLSTHSYM